MNQLTDRQKECLALAAQGLDNREIAEKLCIEDSAVRKLLGKIYRALDVTTGKQGGGSIARVRAVIWYLREEKQCSV